MAAIGLAWLMGVTPAAAQMVLLPSRQVTMFGILATPGGNAIDPKLKKIEPQLRKLFPNHSFRLLASESKRLTPGQAMTSKLGGGFMAGAEMVSSLDGDGNIQFKFALELNGQNEFSTFVKTPPNQLFFCDKLLPDGTRLLIGLGGR